MFDIYAYRLKNKKKILEYAKQYRIENREKIILNLREWRKKNPNYWKKKDPVRANNVRKIYFKLNPWMQRLYWINSRCNDNNNRCYKYYGGKGIKNFLTRIEIKNIWFRDGAKNMKRPSIDRINSNGNYEFSNCRFVELSENVKLMHSERKLKQEVK